MARKRFAISSAGGIEAGAPFVADAALFVEQASPPFANTGRFARIPDATQSLIAPGVAGGAHTFVMGEAASDSPYAADLVMIGHDITQGGSVAGAVTDQVLIGNDLEFPSAAINSSSMVMLGSHLQFVSAGGNESFGGSVMIGAQSTATSGATGGDDASNLVVIGYENTTVGGLSVVIGTHAASFAGESIVIGNEAQGNGQGVAVGTLAEAMQSGAVALGSRAHADTNGVAIGFSAHNNSESSIAIGRDSTANGGIALGRGATSSSGTEFVIGSTFYPIDTIEVVGSSPPGAGGLALFGADFRGGAGVVYIGDSATAPSGAGAGAGGVLYSDSGDLYWLDGGGTATKLNTGGGGGGVTGSGTTGTMPLWSGATAIGDSAIVSGTPYTIAANFAPDTNASRLLGTGTLNWNEIHGRTLKSDSGLFIQAANSSGGTLGNAGLDYIRWGNQAVNGGLDFNATPNFAGFDQAGTTPVTITNAPTGSTPVWIPVDFGGAHYAILAVHL